MNCFVVPIIRTEPLILHHLRLMETSDSPSSATPAELSAASMTLFVNWILSINYQIIFVWGIIYSNQTIQKWGSVLFVEQQTENQNIVETHLFAIRLLIPKLAMVTLRVHCEPLNSS